MKPNLAAVLMLIIVIYFSDSAWGSHRGVQLRTHREQLDSEEGVIAARHMREHDHRPSRHLLERKRRHEETVPDDVGTELAVDFGKPDRNLLDEIQGISENEKEQIMQNLPGRMKNALLDKIKGGSAAPNFLPINLHRPWKNESLIHCIQWNSGGIFAQFNGTIPNFPSFVKLYDPDIILLNEMKANYSIVSAIADTLGMKHASVSSTKGIRMMRGSTIFWKESSKFVVKGHFTRTHGHYKNGSAIELVGIDFVHKGTKYRIATSYISGHTEAHFLNASSIFQGVANGLSIDSNPLPTIIAGDFNMNKNTKDFQRKWADAGFTDCLHKSWITNRSYQTSTAIDYVLRSASMPSANILCGKPIEVRGVNVHLPIPFNIGPGIGLIVST